MSSIAARTFLTSEEYIAAERKAMRKSEKLSLGQIYRFVELETDTAVQTTVGAG